MAKYIFITGGVVSSLGKGLTSASLGALLISRGFSVRLKKLDPYLNVDPGTMSPFEHGEVFVTDDGAETDLDLGHYERFTGVAAKASDSVSSGKIYSNVLEKERKGTFLGKTIQVIPHVTDEIKEFINDGDSDVDFMLCEIGGTVGDIEGLPFFEAIRQLGQEKSQNDCLFIHLTLLPYVAASGELKTKPTQHSVKELRSIGLSPDILICRTEMEIPEKEKAKLALFCNVKPHNVIPAIDLKSIYEAPLAFHENGLDKAVLDVLKIRNPSIPDLSVWEEVTRRVNEPEGEVKIAIVGKYTQLEDAYKSISESLTHGGMANKTKVIKQWVDSESLEAGNIDEILDQYDGILVPGGFGERGTEGMINAITFARIKLIPFFGICLGMQMAVIESARNLAGILNAGSEEFMEDKTINEITPVVFHLKKWLAGNKLVTRKLTDRKGGTMRLGSYDALLKKGSKVSQVYGEKQIYERHRHRYEVDIKYKKILEENGSSFSGLSQDGKLPEIFEITGHPWFIGVQFHPELKSRPFDPHPLFASFIGAALNQSRLV